MWKWLADLFRWDHVTKRGFLVPSDDSDPLLEAVIHLYANGLCIVEDTRNKSKWQANPATIGGGHLYNVERNSYPTFMVAE